MSYQVLARKWRPHNFSEVVGQAHVVKALVNALEHDRLHHAYLFTGTRGVGKTTIARILAKALNCHGRKGFDPCGVCPACTEIDAGRFVDLIEVDAASHTKVDETRDLMDNVQYAPHHGRYKVYLIDEVHMLSAHSFNALLKTLEEPPPHVKFLLATTDPQKLPVTVLSRCLQFNLKRLPPDQIRDQMAFILDQEGIPYEAPALKSLARAADGSMRDGLSLLDQAIVYGGGRVGADDVVAMLGSVDRRPVEELLMALAGGVPEDVIDRLDALAGGAPDYADILGQLLSLLHRIALAQALPGSAEGEDNPELIEQLASTLSPEDVQLYYQIGLIGRRDLPLAPDPRSGLEMVLLRMLTFRPASPVGPKQATASEAQVPPARQAAPAAPARPAVAAPDRTVTPVRPTAGGQERADAAPAGPTGAVQQAAAATAPSGPNGTPAEWLEIVRATGVSGLARELAHHCVLHSVDDKTCVLLLDPGQQQIRSPRVEERLQSALQAYYKKPIKLVLRVEKAAVETPAVSLGRQRQARQQAAEQAIEHDETVLAMMEAFDARVVPGSIEPVDE